MPDTAGKSPPARVKLRLEGPVEAAIELAGMEPLRAPPPSSSTPATTRGAVAAQFSLAMPLTDNLPKGAVNYNLDAEVSNFWPRSWCAA